MMNERLTSKNKEYECRIGGCEVENWVSSFRNDKIDFCETCPFMKYINKLAEYEDREEESNNE